MLLPDVNVLVYAFRADTEHHERCSRWLSDLVNGESAYACSDHVLAGFLRIVTHPRAFVRPDSLTDAMGFADAVREPPNCVRVSPGPSHWPIFTRLCRHVDARGNLVPDAFFAALAIESGSEWVTFDRDYARFPGLRWRTPADDEV
jgi:toxin-antitoxin system PIN domain toxin